MLACKMPLTSLLQLAVYQYNFVIDILRTFSQTPFTDKILPMAEFLFRSRPLRFIFAIKLKTKKNGTDKKNVQNHR